MAILGYIWDNLGNKKLGLSLTLSGKGTVSGFDGIINLPMLEPRIKKIIHVCVLLGDQFMKIYQYGQRRTLDDLFF